MRNGNADSVGSLMYGPSRPVKVGTLCDVPVFDHVVGRCEVARAKMELRSGRREPIILWATKAHEGIGLGGCEFGTAVRHLASRFRSGVSRLVGRAADGDAPSGARELIGEHHGDHVARLALEEGTGPFGKRVARMTSFGTPPQCNTKI